MAIFIFISVIVGTVVVGGEGFVGIMGFESVAGVRHRALCAFCACRLCLPVLAFLALVAVPSLSHWCSLHLADVEMGRASAWVRQNLSVAR